MAKKSKEFSELLYQQKLNTVGKKAQKNLTKKVKQVFGEEIVTIDAPPGLQKMSEVLKSFVRPYQKFAKTKYQLEQLLQTAIMGWNLAILTEEERAEILSTMLTDQKDLVDIMELLEELIERKLKYFAEERRLIMHFELQYLSADDYYLSVASALPESE